MFTFEESYFNSIKVRLEQSFNFTRELSDLFQFHKGTIRTLAPGSHLQQTRRFQFHKGTIRTEERKRQEEEERDFNSIKVRLEHSFQDARPLLNDNFNSIKVRLEPIIGGAGGNDPPLFQFHKGTIRTQYDIKRIGGGRPKT